MWSKKKKGSGKGPAKKTTHTPTHPNTPKGASNPTAEAVSTDSLLS